MNEYYRWLIALAFATAAAGFLLEFWPLTFSGLVAMGFVGRGWVAVPLGLLLDVAYGSPTGVLQYLYFPFTLLAIFIVVVRHWAGRYFFDRSSVEKL